MTDISANIVNKTVIGAEITSIGPKGDTGATGPQGPAGAPGGTDIVNDTTPQLGGNLDTNGNDVNLTSGDAITFGVARMKHDAAFGTDTVVLENAGTSYLATTGEMSINANAGTDASGMWEPYIGLTEGGSVVIGNTTQGVAANRFLLVNMTHGIYIKTNNLPVGAYWNANNMTADRTFTFPDRSGTIAVSATPGASGSFTSQDGKTITVTNGIITGIV